MPALRDLAALIDAIAPRLGLARVRQLHWVLAELTLHATSATASETDADIAAQQRSQDATQSLADLLSTEHLTGYLAAADSGALRTRTATTRASRTCPVATRKVRRSCLRLLTSAAGLPRPTLPPADAPIAGTPAPISEPAWIPEQDARTAVHRLDEEAREALHRNGPDRAPGLHAASLARASLIAHLVHDHDLRVGEVAALRLDGIEIDHDTSPGTRTGSRAGLPLVSLTYTPNPPGYIGRLAPVTIWLSPGATRALEQWLRVREHLVAPAGGRAQTLLVSLRHNHAGAGPRSTRRPRPAGMPLGARGLTRSHVRTIARLNADFAPRYASDPAWKPLPRTLGALRPVEFA